MSNFDVINTKFDKMNDNFDKLAVLLDKVIIDPTPNTVQYKKDTVDIPNLVINSDLDIATLIVDGTTVHHEDAPVTISDMIDSDNVNIIDSSGYIKSVPIKDIIL